MIHIGIDTSNYKTSVAAVDDEGRILSNISKYLDVPEGQRGLRQSDAFFKHSNRLPVLIDMLLSDVDVCCIASVGASYAPRRVEGSYMPCFLAGLNAARVISGVLNIPCHEFSHQEGHAAAIIESGGSAYDKTSILMHLSGGTTEFLKCRPGDMGYETEIVGGSLDISFGQLIDRFGVALGLPFPSGIEIDRLASESSAEGCSGIVPEIRLKDGYFNLSGAETRLLEFAKSGPKEADTAAVSHELLNNIASVLISASDYLCEKYSVDRVYMAGGVASSETIRNIINSNHNSGSCKIIFGDKELSGDNAVGTALLSRRLHKAKK